MKFTSLQENGRPDSQAFENNSPSHESSTAGSEISCHSCLNLFLAAAAVLTLQVLCFTLFVGFIASEMLMFLLYSLVVIYIVYISSSI